MKESTQNIHIEALHYLSRIPFDSSLGIRTNKVNILESLGFSKGTNIALIREFNASHETGVNGLREYLYQQLERGRFVSMLFNGMGWESVGGSPVVYVMSEEDMNEKLEFNDGKLAKAHSQEGKDFKVDSNVRIQTYSRQQSMEMTISGLDNYSGETRIKAGGGFRLQLDDISLSEGKLKFTFSSAFSFNDMGSRVLALSSENDKVVPRYSSSFQVEVVNGQLVYSVPNQKDLADVSQTNDLSNILIKKMFDTDGVAISLLYRYLLSIRPSLKTHQIEGIFSITNEYGVSMEVIDFDGIDTFDLGSPNLQLNPAERLTAAHLKMSGYTISDSQDLISYIQFRNEVNIALSDVISSKEIPNQVKNIVKEVVVPKSENVFGADVLGSVKLSRLLKSLGVYTNEGDSTVKQISTKDGDLYIVSIVGFDMAFLLKDGQPINFTDIKRQRQLLSKILKVDIIDAHFSYLREGG